MIFTPQALAQQPAQPWQLEWNNGSKQVVQFKREKKDDRYEFYFLVQSPLAGTQKAFVKKDEEWSEIPVENNKLKLDFSKAEIKLEDSSGRSEEYSYQLLPNKRILLLGGDCKKAQVKIKKSEIKESIYPAILICESQGKILDKITFISTQDSIWHGTAAFEAAGKGENWKSFSYKDVMNLDHWELSWGSEDEKNNVAVAVPKPIKNKKVIKSALTVQVGLEYISGTIEKNAFSEKLTGVIAPIRVTYQKPKSWWLLGGGYDFFVYNLKKEAAGTSSVSKFDMWGGAEHSMGDLKLRGNVGYINRSLTAPTAGVTATYSAPRLGFEALVQNKNQSYGVSANYATTSATGKYTETQGSLFYQSEFFLKLQQRIQLNFTQLEATGVNIKTKAGWVGISLGVSF